MFFTSHYLYQDLDGSHDDAEDHVIFVQPTDHQGTHILCLNEDVMMTIFSFLGIKQKIQVERGNNLLQIINA